MGYELSVAEHPAGFAAVIGGRGLKPVMLFQLPTGMGDSPAVISGRGLKRPPLSRRLQPVPVGFARRNWRAQIETTLCITRRSPQKDSPAVIGGRR